jgi:hypothetical protein
MGLAASRCFAGRGAPAPTTWLADALKAPIVHPLRGKELSERRPPEHLLKPKAVADHGEPTHYDRPDELP